MSVMPHLSVEAVLEFRELWQEFALLAREEGVAVTPYRGDGPVFFPQMPAEMQLATLNAFRSYVELCREVRAEGHALRDNQFLLWRMFQKMKVHPPSELMSELTEGEVIEIHNSEFVQVFRNLRFFELCSYTLDDLLCRPFWELFQRDESVTGSLIQMGQSVFSGETPGVLQLTVPEHVVLEIDSEARLLSVIQHRVAAPLRDAEGNVRAGVTLIRSISCVPTGTTRKF